ncbi:hypothetical protein B0H11DRAFT_2022692 [Mycena galericulata]|nr:hypothetical protein B0H11DRAFT_2022692 [Mycena galericulata]
MNRDYLAPQQNSNLSRSPSNVSWTTKIKGAIQVGHGVGEAIRGSLGASDLGPHNYTSSGEIAQRGRHEIAQGLARIKGVTTMLPPGPVYDRRHSYPLQQYDPPPATAWNRRSASAHQSSPNPTTASSPFDKYYEHPYPAEQDSDPGFAGLGAGADAGRRKETNDRIMPAFVAPPLHTSTLQTPYPMAANPSRGNGGGTSRSSSVPAHQNPSAPRSQPQSMVGMPSSASLASRNSFAPPLPPRMSIRPHSVASSSRTPLDRRNAPSSITDGQLFIPPSVPQNAPSNSSLSPHPPIPEPSPSSNRHRSLSTLMDKTSKSIRFTGKGKGKEKQPQEGTNKPGRIPSMFLSGRRTRPPSPSPDEFEHPSRSGTRSVPSTPPPHRHESTLETAGYDVLTYDAKDRYPQWPTEAERAAAQASRSRSQIGGRLEPVRSVRA